MFDTFENGNFIDQQMLKSLQKDKELVGEITPDYSMGDYEVRSIIQAVIEDNSKFYCRLLHDPNVISRFKAIVKVFSDDYFPIHTEKCALKIKESLEKNGYATVDFHSGMSYDNLYDEDRNCVMFRVNLTKAVKNES